MRTMGFYPLAAILQCCTALLRYADTCVSLNISDNNLMDCVAFGLLVTAFIIRQTNSIAVVLAED